MRKTALIIASLLPLTVLADTVIHDYRTNTIITPQATYTVTTTPTTTYIVGPQGKPAPIAITPRATTHTYITPTGTYMSIPNGNTTTVIQVSGARK
jgi:hypothetical protein